RAFHLPQGYYLPKVPGTLSQEESTSEVAFIGNNNGDEYRLKFLKFLGRRYELTVWGKGWDALRGSCRVPGRRVFGEDYRKVCRNAKVILGLHSFLWMRSRTCTVSNRLWNVLACGGFLLYQEVRGFDLLRDGKHLVFFSGIADACEKVEYYLLHEEERRRISSKGQREVLEKHSYTSRVKEMLEVLSLCPS
ncbi:MAG TPA: glycosyltransferase family 1 protein, partial [Firmicutes bacterium]|nr:glycosyltransferase family 1 protein [Bacillota bacterium]